MDRFDLAIAYTWIYDKEFVDLIENVFQKNGLKTFLICEHNLYEVVEKLRTGKIQFTAYLDRASDENREFEHVTKILARRRYFIINPSHKVNKAVNKYLMHKKLLKRKFELPKTFVLPSYDSDEKLVLTDDDLDYLTRPFVIKPAVYSGGGEGVERNGTSLEQIQLERQKSHKEQYLIQEKIRPKIIEGKRAWFRVFWAFGKVIPTFWDDYTHIYNLVTAKHIKKYHLLSLYRIMRRLARLNGLDYFSTEIALTKNHRFVLIDYVNDQCDMRLKSNHADGVPEVVVLQFINSMKKKISELKK